MKRFRVGEEEEEMDCSTVTTANVLMMLSRGSSPGSTSENREQDHTDQSPAAVFAARVFECKTCNRQFPSFQALGGHRASHKKPRHTQSSDSSTNNSSSQAHVKTRAHECSICGLEFAIGQALGGHMRRHRAAMQTESAGCGGVNGHHGQGGDEQEKIMIGSKRGLRLDLNLPPSENDSLGLGIGLSMVY